MLRVLIADDEPPARRKLARLIESEPDLRLVGEVADGAATVRAVRELRPDLLFLDVQMPAPDGFAVLDALAGEPLPHVVFVTAFDEYAVRAFDVHAVDYLLKPFDPPRFRLALDRVRARSGSEEAGARIRQLLADVVPRRPAEHLLVDEGERSSFVAVSELDRIEAAGNYVYLHRGGRTHLVRTTLAALERRLDPDRFVRVHRSHIVNVERVRELVPWSHGDRRIVMEDGSELMLSRRYRDRLERFFPGG